MHATAHETLFSSSHLQEKYKTMMEKIEKYANLYELPRKLEDSVKLFYTFQHKKKLDSSETVRRAKIVSCGPPWFQVPD